MSCFRLRLFAASLSMTGLVVFSSHAMASAFQLFDQDAASVGNVHAGYAAVANNASIAFYNPAGMSRFKEQQLVLSAGNVFARVKYRGTVSTTSINNGNDILTATAQGGGYGFVPAMHYVAPLSDTVAFGLSVKVPFGLKLNYGKQTNLRYASTLSSAHVVNISPVLSFSLNEQFAIGFGPDIQVMKGQFNQVATLGDASLDSDGLNTADGTGYGMHAGVMYTYNENTHAGLSYHSQVVHHLTGTSNFTGPIATELGVHQSNRAKLSMTLPPYTALSAYHKFDTRVAVMASVIYTEWSTVQNLVMQNVAGVLDMEPSTNITAILPLHFHNTFAYSVGADYFATDKIILRGGIGYDQTPVSNAYRNVEMPDNNRYLIALGGHFQGTQTLGVDLGWTHVFINKAHVIPPPQAAGGIETFTNGSVTGGADVLAAQIVWDMI
jgi:long-chain fatty acid transport protein